MYSLRAYVNWLGSISPLRSLSKSCRKSLNLKHQQQQYVSMWCHSATRPTQCRLLLVLYIKPMR